MYMRLSFFLLMIFSGFAHTQAQHLWRPADAGSVLPYAEEAHYLPHKGQYFTLDFSALVAQMQSGAVHQLAIPDPEGRLRVFDVSFDAVAEPGYYARHPMTGTYKVRQVDAPEVRGRIDHTIMGFHAMYHLNGRLVLIDPVFRGRTDLYAVYFRDEYYDGPPPQHFRCEMHDHAEEVLVELPEVGISSPVSSLRQANLGVRQYRFATATTGEYHNVNGGSVPAVSAELITLVNRVNDVYEVDAAAKLILVANNDTLIFTNPATDPYTNGNTQAMINENPPVLNARIGNANYDIGHVMGTAAGGLAQLFSVCSPGGKARGVTSAGQLQGDPFYIDYVSHEVGHQFSATHTMNICDLQNETAATAVEPGSGSTIMSYSGLCGPNNITIFSGAYYHGVNVAQIRNFIANPNQGGSCGEVIPTDNFLPEVSLPYTNGFFIPISTPFKLEADAFDANEEDDLTYCWEQIDTGESTGGFQTPLGNPVGNAPIFRSWAPVPESIRYFPRLPNVSSGNFNNQEVLPTYSRDLNFRVTVRDNFRPAGGAVWRDVFFRATEQAGPFVVTSFPTVDTVFQGDYVEINWNVANTDQPPVNCQLVNIRLSVNGGLEYPILLAEQVPNTGSHFVSIPAVSTTAGRIMVEAADNIFFNTTTRNLRVLAGSMPRFAMEVSPFIQTHCIPGTAQATIKIDPVLGFNEAVSLSVVDGLPEGAVATFSENEVIAPAEVTLTIQLNPGATTGEYTVMLRAESPSASTPDRPIRLDLYRSDYATLDAVFPLSGASGVGTSPTFSWVEQEDAVTYALEIATSPAFGSSTVFAQSGIPSATFQPPVVLDESTLYYWRVLPQNPCGTPDNMPIFAFHTQVLSCTEITNSTQYLIPAQGTPTVFSPIEVPVSGAVTVVRVKNIKGSHSNFGHLRGTLQSPGAKNVRLWNNGLCNNQSGNINFGVNDDSPIPFTCPPNTGLIYKSDQPLANFVGDELMGTWNLVVQDLIPGEGGALTEWTLEYCANVIVTPPILVNNVELVFPPGITRTISSNRLLTQSALTGAAGLRYTLVRMPSRGELLLNGVTLLPGDEWTQADINASNLAYRHLSSLEESDNFLFTVRDGQGGWIDITQFELRTDNSVSTILTGAPVFTMHLWPNPAREMVRLQVEDFLMHPDNVVVLNSLGQQVAVSVIAEAHDRLRLETSSLAQGMYFVRVTDGDRIAVGKFQILR
jgi:subtilisin-like proprotein convertase family protein